MRKSSKALVVVWRKKTCCSVETAEHATRHLATATHFCIENKEKNASGGTTHTVRGAGLFNANDHVIRVGGVGSKKTIPWCGFV
jgi:hypothetical protein